MNHSPIKITSLSTADYELCLPLWRNYLTFYKTQLSADTTEETWHNLLNESVPIYGFGPWIDDILVGITHVVQHPTTWSDSDACYLQDLYVKQSIRCQGVGRALIEHVYAFATEQRCNRVYWTTQDSNIAARKLYDKLADLTDMVQYRKNL